MKRIGASVAILALLPAMLSAETTTEYRINKAARDDQKVTVWLTTERADYVLTCETRFTGCEIPDDSIRYTFQTSARIALFLIDTGPKQQTVAHAFNITAVTYRRSSLSK